MKPSYYAFMLRIWIAEEPQAQWRASLEDPHTHHIKHFNTLDDLCHYLSEQDFIKITEPNIRSTTSNHKSS